MLQRVQQVLFVCGATTSGAVLTAGMAFCLGLLVFPSGRDAGGAVVAFVILAIGGLVLGSIASLVGSIYWIAQKSGESWKVTTWIGMAIGLASGLAIWNSALLDSVVLGDIINWFPGTIIFLTTMAFVGGVIGGATSLLRKH